MARQFGKQTKIEALKNNHIILRQKAENLLKQKIEGAKMPTQAEMNKFLHVLEAYQIELELQNEQLIQAKANEKLVAEKYQNLYDFAPTGYYTLSSDGDIVELNLTGAALLGNTRKELINERFSLYISDDTKPAFNLFFQQVFESDARIVCEVTLSASDNSATYAHLTGIASENKDQCLLTMVDITKRKEAEEKIRKLSTAIEQSPAITVITNLKGEIEYTNPKFTEITGYSAQEVLGKNSRILKSGQTANEEYKELWETINSGHEWRGIFQNKKKNGEEYWEAASISPIRNHEGETTHFLAVKEDITDRKNAENLLSASEERFRLIFRTSPDAFIITRLKDNVIMDVNQAFTSISGYQRDEVIGASTLKIYFWANPEERERFFEELKKNGQVSNMECKFVLKDKSIIHGLLSSRTIIIENVSYLLSIVTSIEDLKRAEQEIIKSRDTAERYLNISAEIIITIDPQGIITMLNDSGHQLLGYKKGALIGKNWFETCLPKKLQAEIKIAFMQFMKNEEKETSINSNEVVTRKGHSKMIRWRNRVLRDDTGAVTGILSSGEDITTQMLTQKALNESELKVKSILDAMDDLVFVIDPKGRFTSVNPAEKVVFAQKDFVIGKKVEEVMPTYIYQLFEGALPKVKMGKVNSFEYYLKMPDGKVNWYAMNLSPMIIEEKYMGAVAVSRDITDRKLVEDSVKRSEMQLRELTKYMDEQFEEERKRIAKEIHDGIGQLLTGLIMHLQWVEKKWPKESVLAKKEFNSMKNIIDEGVKEVQQLSIQLRPEMLDNLGLLETLRMEIEKFDERTGIFCDVQFKPDDFEVDFERTSTIYRILMELLTNVYRYANADRVTIKLEMKKDTYEFTFTDNGIGITQDQIDSTSSFGLMTIAERVKKWKGTFSISGVHKEGTTVQISIPF